MKHLLVSCFLCVAMAPSLAQTAPKPAAPAHATATAKPAGASTAASSIYKLPAGIPRGRGPIKTEFSLRYQDLKLGTGADAEPNKIYKVLYTGWLAADGHKFDSSEDHRQPLRDKDGKAVLGDDGKPKLGDAQPISFIEGFGRVIPGFDQGFEGMKVGGKRRLFIPWQLAYGARGRPGPDPAHPGIPPKADLIFDVELVEVAEPQMPPSRPMGNPMNPGASLPHRPLNPPPAGAKPAAPAEEKPGETAQPAQPSNAASGAAPATNAPQQETKPSTPSPTEKPQTETKPQ